MRTLKCAARSAALYCALFPLLALVVTACERGPTSVADRRSEGVRASVVAFDSITLSAPDTITADSATGRCDIPLTYSSAASHYGAFDSSSVRVAGHEYPLNATTIRAFMGQIIPGLEHTGTLLDSSLPSHTATAPYNGNWIIYHSLNGVPQGGAYLPWVCVAFPSHPSHEQPGGPGIIPPP